MQKRVSKIAVCGGGEVTIEDVDPIVEAAIREVARYGPSAYALYSTEPMKPVYQKLKELSYFYAKLMRNRFNYGLEYNDFEFFHQSIDEIMLKIDEVNDVYRKHMKENLNRIHKRG